MKINAGIIGMGIGQKHFDAIEGYKKSQVSVICEKNRSKLYSLKKKYPSKLITNDENKIFKDKKIKSYISLFVFNSCLNAAGSCFFSSEAKFSFLNSLTLFS